MAESIESYIREVEAFERSRAIIKAVAAETKVAIPAVRKEVKGNAIATLPRRGGLNEWVAASRINGTVEVSASTVRVRLKGGRNSKGGRSDVNAINRGRVRAPSWGRRTAGSWHTVTVAPGFFSDPVSQTDEWSLAADRGLDEALGEIR